jgi:hypothetical protein
MADLGATSGCWLWRLSCFVVVLFLGHQRQKRTLSFRNSNVHIHCYDPNSITTAQNLTFDANVTIWSLIRADHEQQLVFDKTETHLDRSYGLSSGV